MSTMFATSAILQHIVLLFTVGQVLSQNNGYIKQSYPYIPCVDEQGDCSSKIGHKVPDWRKVKDDEWNELDIKQEDTVIDLQSITNSLLRLASGSKQCKSIGLNYFCASTFKYRCADDTDYIDIDADDLKSKCEEAKKNCKTQVTPGFRDFGGRPTPGFRNFGGRPTPGFGGRPSFPDMKSFESLTLFKCTIVRIRRIKRRITCSDFPATIANDSFICRRNYKVEIHTA